MYLDSDKITKIVDLYLEMKKLCESNILEDGYAKKYHISLRNLSRAIEYLRSNVKIYGVDRALYDALQLGFGTALSKSSKA